MTCFIVMFALLEWSRIKPTISLRYAYNFIYVTSEKGQTVGTEIRTMISRDLFTFVEGRGWRI